MTLRAWHLLFRLILSLILPVQEIAGADEAKQTETQEIARPVMNQNY